MTYRGELEILGRHLSNLPSSLPKSQASDWLFVRIWMSCSMSKDCTYKVASTRGIMNIIVSAVLYLSTALLGLGDLNRLEAEDVHDIQMKNPPCAPAYIECQ
jgi:hypothetical protein